MSDVYNVDNININNIKGNVTIVENNIINIAKSTDYEKFAILQSGDKDIDISISTGNIISCIEEIRLFMNPFKKRNLLYITNLRNVYISIYSETDLVRPKPLSGFAINSNINLKPMNMLGYGQSFRIFCKNFKDNEKRFKYSITILGSRFVN